MSTCALFYVPAGSAQIGWALIWSTSVFDGFEKENMVWLKRNNTHNAVCLFRGEWCILKGPKRWLHDIEHWLKSRISMAANIQCYLGKHTTIYMMLIWTKHMSKRQLWGGEMIIWFLLRHVHISKRPSPTVWHQESSANLKPTSHQL